MYFWLKPMQETADNRLPLYAPPPPSPPAAEIDHAPAPSPHGFEEINFDIDDFCSENFVHVIVYDV